MARGYICKDDLYNKIVELEDLALQRVNDTPSTMFDNINPAYIRYCAQLNERTNLKHLIIDAPPEDVRPVVRGKWIQTEEGKYKCSACGGKHTDTETGDWVEVFDFKYPFCPLCGADMREERING